MPDPTGGGREERRAAAVGPPAAAEGASEEVAEAGWTPSVMESCFVDPPRLDGDRHLLAGLRGRDGGGEVVGGGDRLPSKEVTTSPTFSPDFAAGEPATIFVTLAPPVTVSIRTPT